MSVVTPAPRFWLPPLLLTLAACPPTVELATPEDPLLIIGLDGATWDVIQPLVELGELPHLEALMASGTRADLMAEPPLVSPALWTTIATGQHPTRHGIRGFFYKAAHTYQPQHHVPQQRRAPALWNILTRAQIPVGVIRWHVTYPPEPVLGAVVAFRYESPGPGDPPLTYPALLQKQIAKARPGWAVPDQPQLQRVLALQDAAPHPNPDPSFNRRAQFLRHIYQRDLDVLRTAQLVLKQKHPPVLLVFFNGIDRASHKFWTLAAQTDAKGPREPPLLFRRAVLDTYCFADWLVNELLRTYGRRSPRVVIVSDHGFAAAPPGGAFRFDLNRALARLGFLRRDEAGRIDWSQTRAFALPDTYLDTRAAYLNLLDREAKGIVPVKDLTPTLNELRRGLGQLRLPTGAPLLELDVPPPTLAPGEQAADLWYRVHPPPSPRTPIQLAGQSIPYGQLCTPDPFNTGVHHPRGVFLAAGPGIAATLLPPLRQVDVLPILLTLRHRPVPRDFPGHAPDPLFEPRFLRQYPPAAGPPIAVPDAGPAPVPSALSPEAIDQLKSLGYLD